MSFRIPHGDFLGHAWKTKFQVLGFQCRPTVKKGLFYRRDIEVPGGNKHLDVNFKELGYILSPDT